ncbi:DUF6783 domain-containing protein [Ruminococcus sp. 1001136sp1]|uniref:DUF6783 domain-containing protein n=1 Tax=unclassified Ruminococcus TaxID=2608920 RepID=UPI00280BBAFE|nr:MULTISPECIES: DUF6783 domain-containing protein [Blautia]MED9826254.1 DUF6783 domain-containing protein [Blautia faecis]MEE0743492.1 DUF6783 domain-containing protein [Blautia faecis]
MCQIRVFYEINHKFLYLPPITFCGYDNRVRVKYTAKRNVQITGMIFQTSSRACLQKAFFKMYAAICGILQCSHILLKHLASLLIIVKLTPACACRR